LLNEGEAASDDEMDIENNIGDPISPVPPK